MRRGRAGRAGRRGPSARSLLIALIGAAGCPLLAVGQAGADFSGTARSASVPAKFKQCPPVDADTGCQFLIVVTDHGSTVKQDPNQPPYENAEDSLIGIQNNSSKPLNALPLSTSGSGLFSFDGDGICNPGTAPLPPGCRPAPGAPPGTTCGPQSGSCSFPAPPGQPIGYVEPGALTGNTQNGYEGPTSWFSNLTTDLSGGHVNFSPASEPGRSTYLSLEEPPSAAALKVGRPTSPPPPPPPVLGKLFDAAAVSGKVLIRLPHSGTGRASLLRLTSAQQLPAGTQVDARHGTIVLLAAAPHSTKPQSGKFGGAIFNITQSTHGAGITTLKLLEGVFRGAASYAGCHGASRRVLQTLHASDRGHYRSRGHYAAATVRGTIWTTIDRCDGTLITVQRGTVVVQDFVRHIRVIVHARQQYLASPRRP